MDKVSEFKNKLQDKIQEEINKVKPSKELLKSIAQLEELTALTKCLLWSEQIYNQMWKDYSEGDYEQWVKREQIAQSN